MGIGFVVLAVVLLAVVPGGGAGMTLLAPLFLLFKLVVLVMVFGSFSRRVGWVGRSRTGFGHDERTRSSAGSGRGPSREQFDEWHRLRHARDEVDGWVEGVR